MKPGFTSWTRNNWQILAILFFYLVFNLYILDFATPWADEATHSLLGLFYHDLFSDWINNPTTSFSKIYDYGITYLTYYPKLTVYYPPLYHLMIAISYFVFGVSMFSAKFVAVLFSLLALFSVYLLGKELFDMKIALLSVILLMTSSIFVFWSRQALIDIPLIFFFTTTAFFYIRWLTKTDKRFFILGIVSGTLGIMTKWQFLIIFPILFLYTLLEHRKKLMQLIPSFLLTFLLISPYLLVSYKIGAFSLQYFSTIKSGAEIEAPRWTEFAGWTYYIEKLLFTQFFFPLSLIIFLSFLYYVQKENIHRNLILIWVLVFYLFFVYLDNKQDRFTMPYMQMFAFAFSATFFNFLKQYKRYSNLLIISLAILISAQFYYSFTNLPILKEPIDNIISDVFEPESNILIATPSHYAYDSVFAFELANYDREFRVKLFRFCTLTTSDALDEYGIKYVIIPEPHDEFFNESANAFYKNIDKFEKFKEYQFEKEKILVFTYKNFQPSESKCNSVCLNEEKVCAKYNKPIEALQ